VRIDKRDQWKYQGDDVCLVYDPATLTVLVFPASCRRVSYRRLCFMRPLARLQAMSIATCASEGHEVVELRTRSGSTEVFERWKMKRLP